MKSFKLRTSTYAKGRRALACLLALLLLALALPASVAAEEEITILFTHDLHSRFLPASDPAGGTYGGYAKLASAIAVERAAAPDAILVDGGDFSMGSLFQTIFATDAAELRLMGALGYDVTTFGNHEYDYRADGLAGMLKAAIASGEPVPAIVEANYLPPAGDTGPLSDALETYGVVPYTIIERGGVQFAIFGILGFDADECAPMSGMAHGDPAETAKAVLAQIEANVPEPRVVICLSHSGTSEKEKESEDVQLAKAVPGIDVIISGHTHSTLEEPLRVGDTSIVSCGEYGKYLGVLKLQKEGESYAPSSYRLVPIDETTPDDPAIAERIEGYRTLVSENYLAQFGGMTFDQVLAENLYTLESIDVLGTEHRETVLGNLIADAYRFAVALAEEGTDAPPVDVALTASGVIRESLPTGEVTVEQVFNALSLGIGADGVPGYPLVEVHLTGKDLKNALEVDASVTGLMPAAQLYFSGVEYAWNPNRMLFDRVTRSAMADSGAAIEDEKLYRVVTGLYCGQMLGAVEEKSFGILSITPRDREGNPITDLEAHILHEPSGAELKEWAALAYYLAAMGEVDARYAGPEGRKTAEPSLSPVALLRDPGMPTLVVLGIILLLILAILLIVRGVRRRRRR